MGILAGLMSLDEYVTAEEAAQMLRYNPESVRRLVRSGKLQADKMSGVWLIYRDAVRAYLRATEGKSKNDPTRGTS